MTLAVRPSGDAAVLVEVASPAHVLGLLDALEAARPPGVVDLVPGERTVLVLGDAVAAPPALLEAWVRAVEWAPRGAEGVADAVEIPVRYDGEDLGEVARELGLTRDDVVALHAGSRWIAAFGGFAPGFAYLTTDHDRLVVARRAEPRIRVPAGAVALAGPYSGVYPRASPGGWRLIGTTDAVLWDAARDPPALLRPGTRVRFRPVAR